MSDSVAIFAEGTFEDQVKELVEYVSKPRVDEERTAFIRPFSDALRTQEGDAPFAQSKERRRKVIELVVAEVKGFGDGQEREIEGFFNLLIAQILDTYPADALEAPVKAILAVVDTATAPSESAVKFRILTNLFNALARTSPLRVNVAEALIALAADDLEVIQLSRPQVEKWLAEWELPLERKCDFLKTVADAVAKAGQKDASYSYLLDRLRLISASSPLAEPATLETISAALSLPSVHDFDSLAKIDAVQSAKEHPLFALLKIFMLESVKEYLAWSEQNAATLTQFSLENPVLEHKIRLLTLASLAAQNVGRDLPYGEIAVALQVEASKVEIWVIDAIRAGLLSGKLSQPTQTLRVTRSTTRSFARGEWETLEKRLATWKSGLLGVLEVVGAARAAAGKDGRALESTIAAASGAQQPVPQAA
ncbi:hypothetical protein AURDEDRAFT_112952, partial [Auricularia subglabra TFB-10046 SS5]